MTGPQIALTDRPDLGAALKRAGDSEIVHAAAEAVVEGLGVDEIVLEAAATKASGVDGAAFITNRRILVTADKKVPSHFEFLELDNLGNVIVLPYKGGWALVAQLYNTYKVWSGFTEKAPQRMRFAARWALTAGREARTEASRAVSSEGLFNDGKTISTASIAPACKSTLSRCVPCIPILIHGGGLNNEPTCIPGFARPL